MTRRAITALALLAAPGCHRDEQASSVPTGNFDSAEECQWRTAPEPEDSQRPLCDVEFREVVRLEGSLDGVIPETPVAVLRDGRFLTATYSRGETALWAPDGEFLDVMGNGPGEGPGEFDYVSGLTQVAEDEFLVFTGLPTIHRYSTDGRFLRSFLLSTIGGAGSAVVYDGAAITTVTTMDGERGFVLRGDSAREIGLPERSRSYLLAADEDIGLWSAEYDQYVLRRHSWPSGAAVDSLAPARDWFPGPVGNEGSMGRLHADGSGLIWTLAGVADPDAPPGEYLTMDEELFDSGDFLARADEYRDAVIEAFAPDGRLVASSRFDLLRDRPDPVHGRIWYRPTEDMLNFVILEAVLIER